MAASPNASFHSMSSMLAMLILLDAALLATDAASNYNRIDECWRGDAKWAESRKKLAGCAAGFGSKTTGGKAGDLYVVTSSADDAGSPAPGTLRYGAAQKKPLWITFSKSMTIVLQSELFIASDKTLDGRGATVHIADGPCLTIQDASNVIVHGLHIHGCRGGGSDGDAIRVLASRNVWIDHNTLSACADGLIDVTQASSAITISNNRFSDHDKVMLLGHSDSYSADAAMKVTVAFNHFGPGLVQRMPRCRFGYFHVVNNDYDGWGLYAIGGSAGPTILSQGNRFRASGSVKEVTKRADASESVWQKWRWRSVDDTFLDGAYFVQSGSNSSADAATLQGYGKFAAYMTESAGALSCTTASAC